jgi:hypothetical protein
MVVRMRRVLNIRLQMGGEKYYHFSLCFVNRLISNPMIQGLSPPPNHTVCYCVGKQEEEK